jgi:hypothetical protein
VTYPNVLVLDYLKKTGKLVPEVQMKAEEYIGLGYQRLLTFEVDGGGFSLMGNPPALTDLTAYGLLEINDMAKVYNVDPKLIERTASWLRQQQDDGGRWGDLRSTAFATWALVEAGQTDTPEVQRALEVLRVGWQTADDPYDLALIANALASAGDPAAEEALQALDALKGVEGDGAHWSAQGDSMMGSHGLMGEVETTALAVHAMLRAKQYPDSVRQGLSYLVRQKDSFGTWHSTQATVLALKALSLAAGTSGAAEGQGQVIVSLDGREQRVDITPDTADVVHTVVFDDIAAGEHTVAFRMQGSSTDSEMGLAYQVAADYYLPWDQVPADELGGAEMQITVDYDRRDLTVNDQIAARARILLTRATPAVMAVVDLGVPPGFTVETTDLDRMIEEGRIARYAVTGRQIILYIEEIQPDAPVEVDYRLQARFPIKAKAPASTAYDYYNPSTTNVVAPVEFVVE